MRERHDGDLDDELKPEAGDQDRVKVDARAVRVHHVILPVRWGGQRI